MKNYLKYLVFLLAVGGACAALAVRFWATEKEISNNGPTYVQTTPDGSAMSILIGQDLIFVDQQGDASRAQPLSELGMKVHGPFDFFSNGDVLLYHLPEEPSLTESIFRFLRFNDNNQRPPEGDEGFYRCSLDSLQCDRWAPAMPAIGHYSFGVEIDRDTNTVYIAATEKHALYKYGEDGIKIAESSGKHKYPNTLYHQEGSLYVADTDNHSIAQVSVGGYSDNLPFGQVINTYPAGLMGTSFRFPTVVEKSFDRWIVIANDLSMGEGVVLAYDERGTMIKQLQIPEGAWPVGITTFNRQTWITDSENFAVYSFGRDGEATGLIDGPSWISLVADSKEQKQRYKDIALLSMGVMLIFLAAGVMGVYLLDKDGVETMKKNRQSNLVKDEDYPPFEMPKSGIFWIPHLRKKEEKKLKFVMWALGATMFLMFTYGSYLKTTETHGVNAPIWVMLSYVVAITVMMVMGYRVVFETIGKELGVSPEGVLIKDHNGRVSSVSYAALEYSRDYLFLGEESLYLGEHRMRAYPPAAIEEIFKRVDPAKKISLMQAIIRLFKQGDTVMYTMLTLIIVAIMFGY